MKFIFPKIVFKWERWKWSKDYGVYVSNLGNFKDRYKRPLPTKINDTGYVAVKTDQWYKLAHRVVMLTWNPIPDSENLTVDHLDSNKRHNAVANLEWVERKENLDRAERALLRNDKEVISLLEDAGLKPKGMGVNISLTRKDTLEAYAQELSRNYQNYITLNGTRIHLDDAINKIWKTLKNNKDITRSKVKDTIILKSMGNFSSKNSKYGGYTLGRWKLNG